MFHEVRVFFRNFNYSGHNFLRSLHPSLLPCTKKLPLTAENIEAVYSIQNSNLSSDEVSEIKHNSDNLFQEAEELRRSR